MKTTPASEARMAEVRALCEEVVGQPIAWTQDLSVLMDCAFSLMNMLDTRENPMNVCEDFAAISALFSYATAAEWITGQACTQLVQFGRYVRDQTLGKWAGQQVVVVRGGGMPDRATQH
jgi:hypothetical protein